MEILDTDLVINDALEWNSDRRGVSILHVPSGLQAVSVQGRSQIANKAIALTMLRVGLTVVEERAAGRSLHVSGEVEERKKRLEALLEQERRLSDELRETQRSIVDEEYGARRAVADLSQMDASQLREHVADSARDHGADCARFGRVFFHTGGWLMFRRALAELARRAGAEK